MTTLRTLSDGAPVRFGLVGAGRIGTSHLEALATLPDAKLAAVVEPRRDVGEAIAHRNGVPWFEEPTDPRLLDLVDAVIIATPPNQHHPIARHFLDHGVHVLCEKPFTLTTAEAREIVELSRARGALAMMASKFRYVDDVIFARKLIEDGSIGDVVLYENSFFGKVMMKDRWNSQGEVAGGGVLMDNGTHSADIARFLLGPIAEVQAQHGKSVQGLGLEDTTRFQFRARDGVMGIANLSWSVDGIDSYLTIFGSRGTVVLEWKGGRYKRDGSPEWIRFGSGYSKIGALADQLKNFVGTLRGKETPRITALDALASVQVIAAAYASATQNKWLAVGSEL